MKGNKARRKYLKELHENFQGYLSGENQDYVMSPIKIYDLYDHFIAEGNINLASKLLDYAKSRYPENVDWDIYLAQILVLIGSVDDAEAICEEIRDRALNSQNFTLLQAAILVKRERRMEAIELYLNMIDIAEDEDVIYMCIVVEYQHLRLYDEALIYAKKAYFAGKDSAEMTGFLCQKFIDLDRVKSGIAFFVEQVEINPMRDHLWAALSWLQFKELAFDEAIESINNAIALNESEMEFLNRKLFYLTCCKRFEEAEVVVDRMLEDKPESSKLLFKKAVFRYKYGSVEESLPLYAKAVTTSNYDPRFVHSYAKVLIELGQNGAAQDVLERSAELNVGDSKIYRELGLFYLLYRNDKNQALTCLRETLDALQPNFFNKLFAAMLSAGWIDEAKDLIIYLQYAIAVDKPVKDKLWAEYKDPRWHNSNWSEYGDFLLEEKDSYLPLAVQQLFCGDQSNGYRNLLFALLYNLETANLYQRIYDPIIKDDDLNMAISVFMEAYYYDSDSDTEESFSGRDLHRNPDDDDDDDDEDDDDYNYDSYYYEPDDDDDDDDEDDEDDDDDPNFYTGEF